MKILSPTFPVKCDVIYWKPHGRIKGYINRSDVGANKNIEIR